MSIEFIVTSIVVTATPGTGVVFTLAAATARGSRAGIVAAVGCTLGILPHIAATVLGAAAVLHTSAVAFSVLKWVGVAYLLYLAWSALRGSGALTVPDDAPVSAVRTIGSALLVNLLNPKLTMFFFAFLPQFVSPSGSTATIRMLALSGVFMLITFVVFTFYAVVAAAARSSVLGRPSVMRWMNRTFAVSFVALGAKLASTRA